MVTDSVGQPNFNNSDVMSYVVRMVVPMRREFACSLDVSHFLHDFTYAQEIIKQAKGSQNTQLRECATYIESKMHGPRNAGTPPRLAQTAVGADEKLSAASAERTTTADPTSADQSETKMHARMISKYKSGLR